jgi:hypothetical protein
VYARRLSLALLASLALHGMPALTRYIGGMLEVEPELEPDLEDDPAGLAAEPPPTPKRPRPEDVVPASLFNLTVYKEPPPPRRKPRPRPVPAPVPVDDPPVVAEVAPEPPPEPEPEPPPEPTPEVAPEPETPAVADAEGEEPPPEDEGDVENPTAEDEKGSYSAWKRRRGTKGSGQSGTKNEKPCPAPHPGVVTLEDAAGWRVERPLIDFYAGNMRELNTLGRVWTHKDRVTKKPIGFRLHLSHCSILKQAGMKSGDVVHDVNGRRIYTLLQAVSAYFVLRDDPIIVLNVTRGGKPLVLRYEIDAVDKRLSRKERKAAAAAAGDLLRMAGEERRKQREERRRQKESEK